MSNLFTINWSDIGKSVLVAFLTAFIAGVYVSLQAGALPTLAELQAYAMAGLAAAVAYLLKNFFTNSNNQLLKRE